MTNFAGVSGNQLRQFIERLEYLEEQKAAVAGDIREVFAEAKTVGFDVKVIRKILKLRKMDKDELREQEEMLSIYLQALEMINPRAPRSTGSLAEPIAPSAPSSEGLTADQDAA